MRLVMTLLVRDESDIVRANLDFHYSQGVDHVIATDNKSVDGTAEILRPYERQGRLTLLFEPGDNHAQGRWVTRMARMAVRDHAADWVINNDADEFWWPREGNLKSTLGTLLPEIGVVFVKRSNFVPTEQEHGLFIRRMRIRHKVSHNNLGEMLPPKVCHRGFADVQVKDGNHDIATRESAGRVDSDAIEILHFPLRSYRQFENKIRLGGAALKRNAELPRGIGETWRRLHDELEAGRLEHFYRSQILDPATVRQGLRDGTLIEDDRLERYLDQLPDSVLHR